MRKEAELEIKDAQLKSREGFEKEVQEKSKELQVMEKRLLTKEDNLEKKFNLLEKKEEDIPSDHLAILIHRADSVCITVEGDSKLGFLLLHQVDEVHQVFIHSGIRMVVREGAV